MKAIFNHWAKSLKKCGRKYSGTFEVASDESSVLMLVTSERGTMTRFNFTKEHARQLAAQLHDAAILKKYNDMAFGATLKTGGAA